jgi:predicted nicotinamide N-methyase
MTVQANPTPRKPARQGCRGHRLLHRINRRYPTTTQRLRFGSTELDFTRIADPDQVLDDVVAAEDQREKTSGIRLTDPLHLPYWAELWDSAGGIASRLAKLNPKPGTKVLDLGCGMGLAGAAAAALGCNVLLADLESPALLLATFNCLPFASRVRALQLDWRTDRLSEKFDLILGSDILYEKSQWEYLSKFWHAHLNPRGTILLGEPGRQTGELFPAWITQNDWQISESFEPTPLRDKPIRIFELQAGASIQAASLEIGSIDAT